MQIHVVQQNQSLFGIAQAYGTTVEELIEANEIPNASRLVVGQTLVIPIVGRFYWVQPGDSLWTIANRFNLSHQELAAINGISADQQLPVGTRLYIP
ncbi:LysM domain-containing protein, partial [Bacillus cereus]|uniref:LysM peptidoglycan-binding domain-containing protein n=2 Tax=Bacillaceae TaxID=186817 RepID=UPI00366C3A51